MQRYADKIADKLGVDTRPVLRWSGDNCIVANRHSAHCHVRDSQYPQGTICMRKFNMTVRYMHQVIAHEVTHLAIKSNHSSTTFARKLVRLGQANAREAIRAKSGKRHHHIYCHHYYQDGKLHHSRCGICHKIKP